MRITYKSEPMTLERAREIYARQCDLAEAENPNNPRYPSIPKIIQEDNDKRMAETKRKLETK